MLDPRRDATILSLSVLSCASPTRNVPPPSPEPAPRSADAPCDQDIVVATAFRVEPVDEGFNVTLELRNVGGTAIAIPGTGVNWKGFTYPGEPGQEGPGWMLGDELVQILIEGYSIASLPEDVAIQPGQYWRTTQKVEAPQGIPWLSVNAELSVWAANCRQSATTLQFDARLAIKR